MLKKGDTFPDFQLENQNGEQISKASLKGQKVILYFYPRDNTP
ncbi:peroxiredoxin, partial [Staphylococcus pseudintermedius]